MQHLKKSTEIKAPIKTVFEFLTNPLNLPSVWPAMVEVSNIQKRASGLQAYEWVYKMAGLRFTGRAEELKRTPNAYVEVKTEGGIPSVFKWTYEDRRGATFLTVDVEYTIPAPVIGKLAEAIVVKLNEHDLDALLANLRVALEMPGKRDGAEARP